MRLLFLSTALTFLLGLSQVAFAASTEDKIKFNFVNEEVGKVVEAYAKASGKKFVVTPNGLGRISLLNSEPVSEDEAFAQLSTALAVNGYAVVKQDDVYLIEQARAANRRSIEVVTELPTVRPERIVTLIIQLKNISAQDVNMELRNLVSKDGELNVREKGNQLIITDWTSALHRIQEIITRIDKPADPKVAKIIETARAEHLKRKAERAKAEAAGSEPKKGH